MSLFDRDLHLEQIAENEFKGNISSNWSINGNPDGGYLMAMIAKAMMKCTGKSQTPIITANFISRCVAADICVRVELILDSKQFSRMSASLFQDGEEKVRALGTFASEKITCEKERYESRPPEIKAHKSCVAMPGFENYTLFENMDVRLDPGCAGWTEGRLAE
ncbi:MAG: thioesterase family protein, partial [Deltaproteobacteria bacterium]|nr:thioesterase family protein [Deltaproteobacteria bacterium]